MDPAETERLRLLYFDLIRETTKAYKAMDATTFNESPIGLNQATIPPIINSIGVEANHLLYMYDVRGLNACYLEVQIKLMIEQILLLTRHVHLAMPNAGETLHRVFCDSVKEIRDCTVSLLGGIIDAAASGSSQASIRDMLVNDTKRVLNALETFKKIPLTNATAIEKALLRVAEDIKSAVSTMQDKAGYTTITLMAGRVGTDAAWVIHGLTRSGLLSDSDVRLVNNMEELVTKSTNMRDQINKIIDCSFPLKQIPEIEEALDDMTTNFVDYYESKLHPNECIEYFERSCILYYSMQGFKSVLNYRRRYNSC